MTEESKTCFVITPIGEDGSEVRRRADQILRHIIDPVMTKNGYKEVIRADKMPDSGSITHQIIDMVINADIVIADLTGQNPNVFYELVLRHAVRKPYIQICDKTTKIPFDVSHIRTIVFDYKDLDSVHNAKSGIEEMIKKIQGNPSELTSPIHESLKLETMKQSSDPMEKALGQIMSQIDDLNNKISKLENNDIGVTDVYSAWKNAVDVYPYDLGVIGSENNTINHGLIWSNQKHNNKDVESFNLAKTAKDKRDKS